MKMKEKMKKMKKMGGGGKLGSGKARGKERGKKRGKWGKINQLTDMLGHAE